MTGLHRGFVAAFFVLAAPLAGQAQNPEGMVRAAEAVATDRVVELGLAEAVDRALSGNRDLEQARLTLEQAEGQVAEAWSSVYPSIDLNTSYTRNLTPTVSFLPAIFVDPNAEEGDLVKIRFGAENIWSGNIALEQPLFRASAFIGVGAAGRFRGLQQETVRGTRHEVVTRVRMLYYELLLAQEQADLIQRSVDRVGESLAETQALNRAGLSSDYDVLRLEVELANLEPDLRRAQNEEARLQRELATELGLEAGTAVAVSGSLARLDLGAGAQNVAEDAQLLEFMGVTVPASPSEEWVGDLMDRARIGNSQVQQAGLNTDLRGAELQVERSQYLPEVSLFATYDVQAQQDGSPRFFGSSAERGYGRNVGLRFSLPIFSGFSRGARVDQMQAQLRNAEVQFDLAEEQLRNQVRTLVERIEEARLRAQGQSQAVAQASRGFEIASAQYREGLSSQLELTDAEVALRQTEFNYAQAVFEYLSSRAQIDQLVGEVPAGDGL